MAPSPEEERHHMARTDIPRAKPEDSSEEKRRPPLYNAEDYASSLRDWTRRGAWEAVCGAVDEDAAKEEPRGGGAGRSTSAAGEGVAQQQPQGGVPAPSDGREMSLRDFSSVAHLLGTLAQDLQFALPSFVQEFVGDPLDGATLLLELLRVVQQSRRRAGPASSSATPSASVRSKAHHAIASPRASTASSTNSSIMSSTSSALPARFARRRPGCGSIIGGPFAGGPHATGGPAQDERTCLECLRCCVRRAPDAPWRLAESRAGLHAVAVAIMSASTQTRVTALEVLTKVCETGRRRHPGARAYSSVSEALTSTRLSLGEPARFHFLVAMMSSSSGAPDLTPAALRFVNAFLESSPSPQERVFVQAELQHAGFSPEAILAAMPKSGPVAEDVRAELLRWQDGYLDVAALTPRLDAAQREAMALRDKVALLERRIKLLREEKGVLQSLERCLKERCCHLEDEVSGLKSAEAGSLREGEGMVDRASPGGKGGSVVVPGGMINASGGSVDTKHHASTPEDEGISSTDNPSSSCSAEEDEDEEGSRRREERIATYENYTSRGVEPRTSGREEEDHETTIEEVIRELRDLVDDEEAARRAEAERMRGGNERRAGDYTTNSASPNRTQAGRSSMLREVVPSSATSTSGGQQGRAKIDHGGVEEPEIVPALILPQPPRRPRSLARTAVKSAAACAPFFEDESSGRSTESEEDHEEEDRCANVPVGGATVVMSAPRTVVSGYSRACGGLRRWETVVAAVDGSLQHNPHLKQQLQANDFRKALRRSESLHHKQVTPMPERWARTRIEARPASTRLDTRRGSLDDGLFFVTEPPSPSSRPPTAIFRPPPPPSNLLRPSPPRQLPFSARARKSRSLERMDDAEVVVEDTPANGDWSLGWDFPRGRPPLSRSATRRANPPISLAARTSSAVLSSRSGLIPERTRRCPPDGASGVMGNGGRSVTGARSSASSSYESNNAARCYATAAELGVAISTRDSRRGRSSGRYATRHPQAAASKVTDLLSGLY